MLLPRIAKRSRSGRAGDALSSKPSGWCWTRGISTHSASDRLAPHRLAAPLLLWVLLLASILHVSVAASLDRFSTSLSGSRRLLAAHYGGWLDSPLRSVLLVSGRRRPQPQRSTSTTRGAILPYSYYSRRYSTAVHRTRRSSSTTSCHNNFNARIISSRRLGRRHTTNKRAATIFPHTAAVVAATSNTDSLRGDSNNDASSSSDVASSYNYDDLTWLGWGIAAAVEIGFTVLIEYATGFIGGYFLGSLADIPRFLRTPSGSATANQQQRAFWNEFLSRAGRTNAKAVQWGSSWAGISAAFGGIDVAVRVARHGKRDEWNTILSSVAAGAWFARKDGPQAMLRGALVYGGLMYLLSGNLRLGGPRQRPFEYEEKAIEF